MGNLVEINTYNDAIRDLSIFSRFSLILPSTEGGLILESQGTVQFITAVVDLLERTFTGGASAARGNQLRLIEGSLIKLRERILTIEKTFSAAAFSEGSGAEDFLTEEKFLAQHKETFDQVNKYLVGLLENFDVTDKETYLDLYKYFYGPVIDLTMLKELKEATQHIEREIASDASDAGDVDDDVYLEQKKRLSSQLLTLVATFKLLVKLHGPSYSRLSKRKRDVFQVTTLMQPGSQCKAREGYLKEDESAVDVTMENQ